MSSDKHILASSQADSSFWRRAKFHILCSPFTVDEARAIQRAIRGLVCERSPGARVRRRLWAFEKLKSARIEFDQFDKRPIQDDEGDEDLSELKHPLTKFRKSSIQTLRNWKKNPHLLRAPVHYPAEGKANPYLLIRFAAYSIGVDIEERGWEKKLKEDPDLFSDALEAAKRLDLFRSPSGAVGDRALRTFYDEVVKVCTTLTGEFPGRSVAIENPAVKDGAPYGPAFEFFRAVSPSEQTEPDVGWMKNLSFEDILLEIRRPKFNLPSKPSDQTIDGRVREAIKRAKLGA